MIALGRAWIPHVADSSFPSDHVTVLSGVGLTLLSGGAPGLAAATLLTALCVAWARVFLGVHFPLDMVGAVGIATLASLAVTPVWRRIGDSATRHVEQVYRRVLALPISWHWLRP